MGPNIQPCILGSEGELRNEDLSPSDGTDFLKDVSVDISHVIVAKVPEGPASTLYGVVSMRVEELPAGTRVAYPGVRANAPSDPKTMRAMVEHALDNPVGQPPLREKIRRLVKAKKRPKILFAFDDVSIPLPPMRSPDIRAVILEEAERRCVEEGVDARDVKFVCSIALHRYIREEEFRHVCGAKLFRKYYGAGQMTNWNAVDREFSVEIGVTSEGEKVRVANEFAEADLMGYANVNWNRAKPTPEIVTPTMDALVADGIHLERFYVFSCCRCAAITIVYAYARLVQNVQAHNHPCTLRMDAE